MPSPAEVGSPEYKKALRLHNKSQKTPPAEHLPKLRLQEKEFKQKFPPPSLSEVLDLSWNREIHGNSWRGSADCSEIFPIKCLGGRSAVGLKSLPGFVLLPGFLSQKQQRELIKATLETHTRHPNENNLDTHYNLPPEGIWDSWKSYKAGLELDSSLQPPIVETKATKDTPHQEGGPRALIDNIAGSVRTYEEMRTMPKSEALPSTTLQSTPLPSIVTKLRWSNIGYFYHWGTKTYEFDRPYIPIPDDIADICKGAVRSVEWHDIWGDRSDQDAGDWEMGTPDWAEWHKTFKPEAGIINFYQLKDTLMAHVDRSELSSTSPLVSISLGQAAVFLIGGLTREERAVPLVLRSGDVLIMSGPRCRRAYHGVPRILEGTLPAHLRYAGSEDKDWELIADYLQTTRININVRQVFPPNFQHKFDSVEVGKGFSGA